MCLYHFTAPTMNTFWQTARFELRYHLNQPSFYLFYLMTVAQGFLYGLAVVESDSVALLYSNAPGLFFSVFSTVGVVLTALAALLTGQSLLRDRTYRVGEYLYALPLDEQLYFAGKLLGVLGTCVLLATGIGFGLLALPLWISLPTGPFPLAAILTSFGSLLVPNLLIIVSLTYALTAFFQRMAGAYLALLALVVGQVLFRIGEHTVIGNDLLLLSDPFGHVLIREALSQQTPAGQLARTLPFPDLLLINRLLWLGLSGGLLVRAADRLTFQQWASGESGRANRGLATEKTLLADPVPFPALRRQFTARAHWQTLIQLTGKNFLYVVRQPAFGVVGALLVLAIIGYASGLGNLNETGQRLLPFTSRMTYVRLPLLGFIGLCLIVFSGELLHRERSSGMWPLVDVLPQPGWVLLVAKYGAMLGVAGLLTATLFLTGVSVQLLDGQTPIDWRLYATDLLADGLLRYAQLIALAFLIQTIIPNRLLGQLASATVFILLLVADQTGWRGSWLFLYSSLPHSWHYSELTGYGSQSDLRWVYAAMWSMVALLFLLMATGIGQRGVLVPIQMIGQRWRASLRPGYVVWLTAVTTGVFVSQLYLRFPVNEALPGESAGTSDPIAYRHTTQRIVVQNRSLAIHYQYVHGQNLARLQAIVGQTIRQGSSWLGTFPDAELTLAEVPFYQSTNSHDPTRIELSERDGWLTDAHDPEDAGQFHITIARTVLRHWIQQKTTGNAFISRSLPDYLALRIVQQQRGDGWLRTELARLQRTCRTQENHSNSPGNNPALLATRGPLSLTCIGEIWGHDRLCRQIGQFVKTAKKEAGIAFHQTLTKALPDSLTYLTTYLHQTPRFDFGIGPVGQYPDRISVAIQARKYTATPPGTQHEQLLNDYVPVVLLDAQGKVVHRQLVRVGTEGRSDNVNWLPAHPDAVAVEVDPLGAWPEVSKQDNRKQLARL